MAESCQQYTTNPRSSEPNHPARWCMYCSILISSRPGRVQTVEKKMQTPNHMRNPRRCYHPRAHPLVRRKLTLPRVPLQRESRCRNRIGNFRLALSALRWQTLCTLRRMRRLQRDSLPQHCRCHQPTYPGRCRFHNSERRQGWDLTLGLSPSAGARPTARRASAHFFCCSRFTSGGQLVTRRKML